MRTGGNEETMKNKRKLLVIGGSYFYGRVFVMEAAKEEEFDITLLNRGTYSMAQFGVRQVTGDRHDAEALAACGEDYDAVIDFCAYRPGDVQAVLDGVPGRTKQYVLISTVDVYERGEGGIRTEEYRLEERRFGGEAGDYIAGKVALERETARVCGERKIPYTILRPAILYGPYNYAPRESVYIQMMLQNHVLPHYTDADGKFQCVYVKDAAQAALRAIGNERAYGQAYNLCQDEIMTYGSFLQALEAAAEPEVRNALLRVPFTVAQAEAGQAPLPFPATAGETQLCDNGRSRRELGVVYTDFAEGIGRTYRAFKHVYAND